MLHFYPFVALNWPVPETLDYVLDAKLLETLETVESWDHTERGFLLTDLIIIWEVLI